MITADEAHMRPPYTLRDPGYPHTPTRHRQALWAAGGARARGAHTFQKL